MSDYISIKDDRLWQILFDEACVEGKQAERIQKELEKITVDEKEIIRKPFERVVERLEKKEVDYRERAKEELEEWCLEIFHLYESEADGIKDAIKIVKEECGINE